MWRMLVGCVTWCQTRFLTWTPGCQRLFRQTWAVAGQVGLCSVLPRLAATTCPKWARWAGFGAARGSSRWHTPRREVVPLVGEWLDTVCIYLKLFTNYGGKHHIPFHISHYVRQKNKWPTFKTARCVHFYLCSSKLTVAVCMLLGFFLFCFFPSFKSVVLTLSARQVSVARRRSGEWGQREVASTQPKRTVQSRQTAWQK